MNLPQNLTVCVTHNIIFVQFVTQNLSPEEEHRRRLRRERNKQAAARCRKRRMDQTEQLMKQTEILEEEKRKLQRELQELQAHCQELEACLSSHECEVTRSSNHSMRGKMSSQVSNNHVQVSQGCESHSNRKQRPSSLPLNGGLSQGRMISNPVSTASQGNHESSSSLLSIQTPSNGLFSMEGLDLSGLTPLLATPSTGGFLNTPSSCSGQTRSDGGSGVTPTDGPHKLVSL